MKNIILAGSLCAACIAWSNSLQAESILGAVSTNQAVVVAVAEPKDDMATLKRDLRQVHEKLDALVARDDASQRIEQALRELARKVDDMARDIDRLDDKVERLGRN